MTAQASLLIPTYNEEADIEECLACIERQDVGPEALEVIVIDGGSPDRTVERARARAAAARFGRFRVIQNPQRRTAAGLSLALPDVTTPIVVRVDARSRIPNEYVRAVSTLLDERRDVGVVGGAQVPFDGQHGTVASGIARALSNRFTTGLSRYRRSSVSGPADTVWMGAFRTEDLRKVGGWDSSHGINEDYELSSRFLAAGYKVWFDASLRSGYVPRRNLSALASQYYAYGQSKGGAWAAGKRPAPRQIAVLALPLVGGAAAVLAARRVGVLPTAAASVAGLLVIDHVGAPSRPAPLDVRVASVTATITFGAAWLTGVVTGWRRTMVR
jgi:glycosyltransferase involved in cell wall biosynthesis